ncbi:hypothetical protein [uncultured Thiohalocapsa sp.]|uniref:hypothetical protein n=1 Tax=uncultured Thiohalocapsa sp. TaxID=768990 RepID=UPI0025E80F0C|nr:hypothetical protein [uncultured Thiohalocapsa sp.]
MDPLTLGADALVIGRLHLRAATTQRQAAVSALEQAHWPHPTDRRWVLLRRLKVQSGLSRIAAEAAAGTRAALDLAVHGGNPGAGDAGAVFFHDLDDLLAHLARDLALGLVGERWFWHRLAPKLLGRDWAAPGGPAARGAAVHRLLAQVPLRLAAVAERLHRLTALPAVWASLGSDGAADLAARLAHATGLDLAPRASAPEPLPEPPPAALLQRWRAAVTGLPTADARVHLSACLLLLEWRPARLAAAPVASIVAVAALLTTSTTMPPRRTLRAQPADAAARAGLTRETPPPDPARRAPSSARASAAEHAAPSAATPASTPPAPAKAGQHTTDIPAQPAAADTRAPASQQAPNPAPPNLPQPHPLLRIRDAAPTPRPAAPPAPTPASGPDEVPQPVPDGPQPIAADTWQTGPTDATPEVPIAEAGVFYLINFLNRPEAAALLAAPDTPEDGWLRLWWLGCGLGLAADGAAAGFLAARLGLDDAAGLPQTPRWPALPALLDLGRRLYAEADDLGEVHSGLWQPELLRVPGQVAHPPTHLDVRFPPSAVRLAVRLAALDIDPGWVPWLGRVVRFHYDAAEPPA